MAKQTITIDTKEENPEPVEIIADAILKVSEGFEKLNNSQLSRRAIILLLHDAIGVTYISKKQIGYVLDYAPKMKDYYIKQSKERKSVR